MKKNYRKLHSNIKLKKKIKRKEIKIVSIKRRTCTFWWHRKENIGEKKWDQRLRKNTYDSWILNKFVITKKNKNAGKG